MLSCQHQGQEPLALNSPLNSELDNAGAAAVAERDAAFRSACSSLGSSPAWWKEQGSGPARSLAAGLGRWGAFSGPPFPQLSNGSQGLSSCPECREVAGFGTPSIGMVAAKLPCWLLPGWGSVHGSCTNSVTLGAAPHPPSWLRFSPFTQRKRSAERLSNLPRSKRKERRDRSPTPITVQPASSQRGSTWNTRGVTRDLGLSQSWRSPGADTAPGAAERHRLPGRFRWASQIPSHRPRPLSVVF